MDFWIFMLVCVLLTPGLMAIGGWYMWKHTPKSINALVGYRTARSMKNLDTWAFAHENCGRRWARWGLWMLLPSGLVMVPAAQAGEGVVAAVALALMGVQLVILLLSIVPTERALKETFDQDGKRK